MVLSEAPSPLIEGGLTGVPRLQENATPEDPTVGLCLGAYGGPRGGGGFL